MPDAMDSALEADILKNIPRNISEMYVEATTSRGHKLSTNRYIYRFLLVSLNIDAILQETTIYRRGQKVSAMTDGLGLGVLETVVTVTVVFSLPLSVWTCGHE